MCVSRAEGMDQLKQVVCRKVAENAALWGQEKGTTVDERHFPLCARGSLSFNSLTDLK